MTSTRTALFLALGLGLGLCLGGPSPATAEPDGARGIHLELVNGQRVKTLDNTAVYVVDRGILRHVTYPAYTRMFSGWGGIAHVAEIPDSWVGERLGMGTEIVRVHGEKTVWLIDNERTRRAFTTAALFGPNGFSWSKVKIVEQEWIQRFPRGPDFSPHE